MKHFQQFIILNLLLYNIEAYPPSSPLRFKPDGTFKILQFTDLHFGSYDSEDMLTTQVMETLLDIEEPDLVIMTVQEKNYYHSLYKGDSVSGYAWDQHTRGWTASQWQKVTKPLMERSILWAFAPGNHDREVRIYQDEAEQSSFA
jgi:hypothetical protein